MKAYVSIDLEGLPGVSSVTMVSPDRSQFQRAVKIMTRIVNEVSQILLKSGFERVVVADSHGLMTTIDYLDIPRGVSLIQGYPRPFSMVTGIDSSFNMVLYLGYHAAAGVRYGFLDHTYSGGVFHEIYVNGVKASEYLVNTLYVNEIGVPVALLAGDHYLKVDVEKHTPWVVFVEFKKGVSRYAAIYDSLDEVIDRLRIGVEEAITRLKNGKLGLINWSKPYSLEIRVRDPLIADALEHNDKFTRIDAYSLKASANTAKELLGLIEVAALIGYGIESLKTSIK